MASFLDWEDYESAVERLLAQGVRRRVHLRLLPGVWALHVEGDSPLRGGHLTGLHVSLAFEGEIEPWLLRRLQRRWGRPRETCLRFTRVGCGGAGILAGSCAVGRCPWLRQAHDGGSYRSREPHISF